MSTSFNPYASPQATSQPRSSEGAVWRDGDLLVVGRNAALPDRCVMCNADAGGQHIQFNLSWHSPLAYLGLLGGLVPYVLVALIVQKKMKVRDGVCEQHRRRRRGAILMGWLAGLLGVAVIFLSIVVQSGWPVLVGVVVILLALVVGMIRSRVVWPARITSEFAWLKGVSNAYLNDLPDEVDSSGPTA